MMDLIKGADHPKMITQLHKIAIPTAESIKNCVVEFVAREQAAKGDGANDEVIFLAQVPPPHGVEAPTDVMTASPGRMPGAEAGACPPQTET